MNPASLLLYALGALVLLLVLLYQSSLRTVRRIEEQLPPSGMFVDVDGQRLHVRDEGEGPALVLLHGLNGQMRHVDAPAIRALAQRYRVVTVDRPGAGYSTRRDGAPADLSAQARCIAGLVDRLQLGRPTVVGHSLGAAVALTLALEHPARVGSLGLVAPLTHSMTRVPTAFRLLAIDSAWLRIAVAWLFAIPLGIAFGKPVLKQVFAPEPVPRDFDTRAGGLHSLRPAQFLGASDDLRALGGHMPRLEARHGELTALGIPLRVLFGRGDRLLDWQAHGQALVNKVAGSRLELVEGGHMLPLTQPARTARFIEEAASAIKVDRVRGWK